MYFNTGQEMREMLHAMEINLKYMRKTVGEAEEFLTNAIKNSEITEREKILHAQFIHEWTHGAGRECHYLDKTLERLHVLAQQISECEL